MAKDNNFSTELGPITIIDPSWPRHDSITYVWQEYYAAAKRYFDCTEEFLYLKDGPLAHIDRPEFLEVVLFKTANHFLYNLPYFEEYFSTTFKAGGRSFGERNRNFYYRVVIPKPIFEKIHTIIQEAGLDKIEGFLFEIIILAQEAITRQQLNKNYPTTSNEIKSLTREINNLVKIIDTTLLDYEQWRRYMTLNSPEKLVEIKFIFESHEPIQIKNAWLTEEVIRIIKDHYDGMHNKYWRLSLMSLPKIFEERSTAAKFDKLIAQSYYNFLVKEKLVQIDSPYPNTLMSLIINLLSPSFISFSKENDEKGEHENRLRTLISRRSTPKAHNQSKIETPKLERLQEYFNQSFIALGDKNDYEITLLISRFICSRHVLPIEMQPEIMHLSACIRAANRIIGFQFSNTSSDNIQVPEFQSLRKFIQELKEGEKIKSINIVMENLDGNHEFSHRTPLYLIEKAIHQFYEKNPEEFESNIIKTRVEMDPSKEFPILEQGRFNQPHERFFVRLTHSMFNYFEAFAETYTVPYERYILEIISSLYQHNGVFKHGSEEDQVNIVSDWYQLDSES